MAGRNVLITAGPRSKTSIRSALSATDRAAAWGALAAEALRRGAAVTLVTGPTHLTAPHGATVKVRSAAMHAAVMERTSGQDAIVMSAAVADYTPTEPAKEKVKKADGPVTITNRTKDILGDLGKLPSRKQGLPVLVGFAAETNDVKAYAQGKLQGKAHRLIVASDTTPASMSTPTPSRW